MDQPTVTEDPTNDELLSFARSLIDDRAPFLDTAGLETAIAEHHPLWVKLFRVDAGLADADLEPKPNSAP
ncbi:MAG TPA: hypothetical protein VNH45_12520 [Gaiellaceae bacterium]|jgi:hypothetical protein|nr:hypothetical protein [Gaiellaceae bacterium]